MLNNPEIPTLRDGPARAATVLILAHGAGLSSASPFMAWFAQYLSRGQLAGGLTVWRFDFPYMAVRTATGGKRPPDRPAVLENTWHRVIRQVRRQSPHPERLLIGGKSMGGRIASMVAEPADVDGVVCLGYPFHPPGQPEKQRTKHLATLKIPMLICQGERDPFGGRHESSHWQLAETIRFCWLADGDHSFKPRKKSGRSEDQNRSAALAGIIDFIRQLAAERT